MNNNLINTIGKTDEELSKIQIDYLKEKKTEYIEKLYNAEIDSREDILDIFQNNAPILDIDNGNQMIRRGEGEDSIIIDFVGTYYTTTVAKFEDALAHALKLKNDRNSDFYTQSLEEKKSKRNNIKMS